MKQNTDYELIPGENDFWNIRIMTGDYIETVFNFGAIKVSDDGESLIFNADVISSPMEINPDEDLGWHEVTGGILLDILEQNLERIEKSDNES